VLEGSAYSTAVLLVLSVLRLYCTLASGTARSAAADTVLRLLLPPCSSDLPLGQTAGGSPFRCVHGPTHTQAGTPPAGPKCPHAGPGDTFGSDSKSCSFWYSGVSMGPQDALEDLDSELSQLKTTPSYRSPQALQAGPALLPAPVPAPAPAVAAAAAAPFRARAPPPSAGGRGFLWHSDPGPPAPIPSPPPPPPSSSSLPSSSGFPGLWLCSRSVRKKPVGGGKPEARQWQRQEHQQQFYRGSQVCTVLCRTEALNTGSHMGSALYSDWRSIRCCMCPETTQSPLRPSRGTYLPPPVEM